MKTIIVGINHKTAPIAIREKFFCNALQQELLLSELKNEPSVVESLVLSTCNRTEICSNVLDEKKGERILINKLLGIKNLSFKDGHSKYFYSLSGEEAVRHLFKVATGLDSLILGEKQILGQVKDAVELSRKKAMLGKQFNLLTQSVIRAGKKAQNETTISFGGASLSWAAVVMAEQVLGELKDKTVLIAGAGKMSALAVEQIRNKNPKKIFVMNRTQTCAEALAVRCQGEAVSFCDIKEILSHVDVCICSVGAPHYILEKETIETVMANRPGQKLVCIDISMPRNIDPRVAAVSNVLLFCIDDLVRVVEDSMKKRQAAVHAVEQIIASKIEELNRKIARLSQDASFVEFKST